MSDPLRPARGRPGNAPSETASSCSLHSVADFGDDRVPFILEHQVAGLVEVEIGVPVDLFAEPVDNFDVLPRDDPDHGDSGVNLVAHAVDDPGEVERLPLV